jgi:hypothetical protein
MSNRDHDPVIFDEFLGLYARGEGDALPPGFLNKFDEFRFSTNFSVHGTGGGKIATRNPVGTVLSWTGAFTPSRFYWYPKSTGGRFIALNPATGAFRDQTAGTTILTIAGVTDFSAMTINDRFYFMPHNREIGRAADFLYVYDPALSATARKAAAAKPAGVFTIAAGAAGNTEPGLHILGVCYETNTGFVTKPALYQTITAASPRTSISLTAIPLGPAGTVARRIVMSKVIKNYDGNAEGYNIFFALKINDNTTTVLANAVNLYDTQLVESADYLKDNLEEISAGLQMCSFNGRLAICGENADSTLVRVSKPGEPETFSAIDGFIKCYKGMGYGPVRNIKSTHGVLYMFKRYSTYTCRDNGKAPSSWQVDQIDAGLGAEVFSVAEVWDSVDGSFRGGFFVANYNGFYFLNGSVYSNNLAYNIEAEWSDSVEIDYLNKLEAVFDSFNKCAYINASSISQKLYLCDLQLGFDRPRFARWLNGSGLDVINTIHLFIASADGKPVLLFQSNNRTDLNKVDLTTSAISILEADSGAQLEFVLADPEYQYMHLGVMKFMGEKSGTVAGEVSPAFATSIPFTLNFTLVSATSRLSRHQIDTAAPMIKVTFGDMSQTWLRLEKVIFYLSPEDAEAAY